MLFLTIQLGSRKLVAFPDREWLPDELRIPAIRCYPVHTRKKIWVRACIQLLAKFGLIRKIFPCENLPLGGISVSTFESWMEEIREILSLSKIYPVFVWPADMARNRIYLYFLDAEGRQCVFCKFGTDVQNNQLIENEAQMLGKLEAMQLGKSKSPKLVKSGKLEDLSYVLVETTPDTAQAIEWKEDTNLDALIDEYSGIVRNLSYEEIMVLDWWRAALDTFSNRPELIATLHEAATDGVEVCRVHGDLNRTNILVAESSETWLLDWERSDECGPVLTDRLCVAVDKLWCDTSGDSAGNLLRLKKMFPELHDEKTRGPGILGLAFLGVAGFTPALSILAEWFPEEGSQTS